LPVGVEEAEEEVWKEDTRSGIIEGRKLRRRGIEVRGE